MFEKEINLKQKTHHHIHSKSHQKVRLEQTTKLHNRQTTTKKQPFFLTKNKTIKNMSCISNVFFVCLFVLIIHFIYSIWSDDELSFQSRFESQFLMVKFFKTNKPKTIIQNNNKTIKQQQKNLSCMII